jgi:thiosulfate/3-mercaptopyruvate sulfurtransferase
VRAKTGRNGRHPLPERAAFARTAATLGIAPRRRWSRSTQRRRLRGALWWMLRWLGHAEVAVLDGGSKAWRRGGRRAARREPVPRLADAAPYPDRPSLVAERRRRRAREGLGARCVLDARSAERFRGEKEPIDPVAGRIPGALQPLPRDNLLPGGLFKPAERCATS